MALEGILKEIEREVRAQRRQEQQLLQEIASLATPEFAKDAAGELDSRKHLYGFEAYLGLLGMLKNLLLEGMPAYMALDGVQSGYGEGTVLELWKYAQQ